jgi:hypothetical protein
MDIELIGLIVMTIVFSGLTYGFRYSHKHLWQRFSQKYNLSYNPGDFIWGGFAVAQDIMTGSYRGRKLRIVYSIFMGKKDIWQIKIQLKAKVDPDGIFRLDQKGLLKKKRPPLGDKGFDKHTRIIKDSPRGYLKAVLSDQALRESVSDFFANPFDVERKINLTPKGMLWLQDQGVYQTERRLLANLNLLSDLADAVETLHLQSEKRKSDP